MTCEDWIKILEENSREDWEWYARWLRDEQENESKARAVEWMIFENREPYYHPGSKSFDWYNLKNYLTKGFTKESKIQIEIYEYIKGFKTYFENTGYNKFSSEDWKGFDTKLAAKLALVSAYEEFRLVGTS
jgi:hypothetical protein